jgi:hypothetical protein
MGYSGKQEVILLPISNGADHVGSCPKPKYGNRAYVRR